MERELIGPDPAAQPFDPNKAMVWESDARLQQLLCGLVHTLLAVYPLDRPRRRPLFIRARGRRSSARACRRRS